MPRVGPSPAVQTVKVLCANTQPYGGICVNLSKMDKIIAVHPDDGDAVVQAGVGCVAYLH